MSKECVARPRTGTKPQRSLFQRVVHSSLFRSCWSDTRATLDDPNEASTSLIVHSGGRTDQLNYASTENATKSTTLCSNQETPTTTTNITELKQPDLLAQPSQVEEVVVDSYSTSGSEEFNDEQKTAEKMPTGTSLADYLRAESHNSGNEEETDKFPTTTPTEQLTEWQRFTTMPNFPTPKKLQNEVYDDLVFHSLDDYDENVEWELELKQRNPDEPVEFGPITREEYIRLTFCRIKRHNACSKLQNDVPKSYYFSAQVGEGSFSTVYEAYRMEDKKQYAIKVANKRQISRERKIQYVIREKDIMATLNYGFKGHPFIANIFCTFQEADKLYYVISYASNGELLMWLRRLGSFDLQVSQFYASEIVSALEYIHECGIIHRDLKPENILIRNDWHIMLSDFGSSKVIGYEGDEQVKNQLKPIKQRSTFVGTAQFISPEVMTGRFCGPVSDFWALGGIIFQMISGQPPFRGINEYQILQKVTKLQYKFPNGFDEVGKDLVQKLLIPEIEKRLGHNGIDEIKEHAFFSDVDWKTITMRKPPELKPYLPASCGEPEFYSDLTAAQMETGLSNSTIARLMGISQSSQQTPVGNVVNETSISTSIERKKMTEISRQEKMETQKRDHPYHEFVGDTLILKSGLIDKKKGLFARRRMFLLTQNGRLIYVDPVRKILKGEVPISREVKTEAKNFRTFFVHTPSRTYFLFDPECRAVDWCKAIEDVRNMCFGKPSLDEATVKINNQRSNKNTSRQFKSSISN